ncbi:protein FAR1-RELATED SEQUENCE 9-like [Silene latifolia]|uniref:protein FAR1-RELATED SEQUENCE 9-like n=1 Tax=Silene latifolia TaxID=37657 RepID=UPI003D7832E3
MSFTPFTGVDNHKRSVTFCGALVAHEDADSFKWVFTRFLGAMGGKEPNTLSPIRMLKLNAIIWDEDIEPAEFDAKWEEIGREHNVNNIGWFQEMYAKRRREVMAHCRDLDMGGVMRTTQRSESENSFFKRFENTLKATCSCRMLERKGIICRHVIWIYSSNGVKIIPEQCIVKRWCKDARLSKMFDCNGEATEDIDIIDGKQIAMSVMWSEIHQTVGLLMGKLKNDVENFSCLIRQFKEKLSPLGSPLNKRQHYNVQIQNVEIFTLDYHDKLCSSKYTVITATSFR